MDFASTIGDLSPILAVGGYSREPALTIANDVMSDMITQRFNWKFNRLRIPSFYTISWQQDYASLIAASIGWIESLVMVDINNTALPKPIFWPKAVRDLQPTSAQQTPAPQVCWKYNSELIQGVWPGTGIVYTNPLGAPTTPANSFINILDTNGNIQVLTTFGTTGSVTPTWPAPGSPRGTVTNDGSCQWTVADPFGQGFRLSHVPAQTANVYQVNVLAQKTQPKLLNLESTLDPIPDDYSSYFRDGFITYLHRHSANPSVKSKFEKLKLQWEADLFKASGQGDRETENASFVPESSIMDNATVVPIGPAWPWGPYGG